MKKRVLSMLLVLTFLLSVFMLCNTAAAASSGESVLSAELLADKSEYAPGAEVQLSLKVLNNSAYSVKNIRTELVLPEGLGLKAGQLVGEVFDLAVAEKHEKNYVLSVPTEPTTTASTTQASTTTMSTTQATTAPATTVPGTTAQPTVPTTTVPAVTTQPTVPTTTVPAVTTQPTVPTTTVPAVTTQPTVPTTTVPPVTTEPAVPTTTTEPTVPATTVAPTTQAPTTQAPTTQAPTQAPTTAPSGSGDNSDTGDISLYIYGALAIFSLSALVILSGGFKGLLKQRWFILVLCAAVLLCAMGPMAVKASADSVSLNASVTVKVNGVDATITAKISHDVVAEEQVAFKKDGQFLWNKDVEMGYYMPTDCVVDGQTTSRDGDFRPEVTAPYIDMLFGCTSTQTNQFVAGEFTTNIFNEQAQQTALIGLTDDPASQKALALIDEDEWIIAVIDGKLVVTGWYDNATVAAARALYALATADADNVNLTLPMIGKMDYVNVDMPAFTAGNFLGGMDSDGGAVVLRYNEITAADFDAYGVALTEAGYALYESNTMDGFKQTKTLKFATYVKGDDAILVQYLPVSMLDQDPDTLTAAEKKVYDATFRPDGDSIRLILTSADLLGNNDAANTGWTDAGITPKLHLVNLGQNIGQCQIFTLADGSFIVVDGGHNGDAEQLYRTLKDKNERADGKIVIAAWFLTHDHIDHTGAVDTLSQTEYAAEITVEQVVVNNHAASYIWRGVNAPYRHTVGYTGHFSQIDEIFSRFAQGSNYKRVMPHMGQVLKIRNAEVEMLNAGDEDVYPVHIDNDNGLSLIFRVSFPERTEQTIMIEGDSAMDQACGTIYPLMLGEVYADIVQVAHHGLGGQTSSFYPMYSDVDVIFYTTNWAQFESLGGKDAFQYKALMADKNGTGKMFLICEEYVQTLELPFDVDKDHVLRTKIGSGKTQYQDSEMDIAMLPAFRFQNTWNQHKDTLIAYLKNYTADVLILPLIDQNTTTMYNKADLVNELYEALDYANVYYAPVWGCETDANMQTGDGTMGHLILSTYPILKAETGILVEGNPGTEGRGYAHVLLDVERTKVDLVATHFGSDAQWTKFAETYEQWGAYTVIAGDTKIGGDVEDASIELTASAFASNVTILGSKGILFSDAATNHDLADATSEFFVNSNLDAIYTVKLTIPVAFDFQPNENPIRQAIISWWNNGWGRSESGFNTSVEKLREQNAALVTLQNIGNTYAGIENTDNYARLLGYEYSYFSMQMPTLKQGNLLLSHYPITVQPELQLAEATAEQTNSFSHVIVHMDADTDVDVWFGYSDLSAAQLNKLAAAIKAVADETGRPFILSTNDLAELEGKEYYAGYECYNYYTTYIANVMVTTGPITITNTEAVYSGISWGGVDKINILDFELSDGALTKEQEPLPDVPDPNPNGLDVALVPAFCFDGKYSQNAVAIHKALVNLGADVLVVARIDQNVPNTTAPYNGQDIPGALATALKSVYPYSYFVKTNAQGAGYDGHLLLSKYEIKETADIALGSGNEAGTGYARAKLDVDGTSVDVFFGWMNHTNYWSGLAPAVKASTADAWVVVGDMAYARPEKGGIEALLGQTISAAYPSYAITGGGYHMCNIISSSNGTFSNVNREACTDRFGGRADPLYQATITFAEPEPVIPEIPAAGLKVLDWWCNFRTDTTNRGKVVDVLKNSDYDIVSLQMMTTAAFGGENGAKQFAEDCGYDYYAYLPYGGSFTANCGMILSRFPLAVQENVAIGTANMIYGHVVVDLGVKKVDIYHGLSIRKSEFNDLIDKIEVIHTESGREFILTGTHFGSSYFENTFEVETNEYLAHNGGFVVSDGIAVSDGAVIEEDVCAATSYAVDKLVVATLKLAYEVTVDGNPNGKFVSGTTVNLTAADVDGKVFDKWEVVKGEITLTDATSKSVSFTMPAADVELKAIYKDEAPVAPIEELKVMDWWCRYDNNATLRSQVVDVLKDSDCDIISLQMLTSDAISTEEAAAKFAADCGYAYYARIPYGGGLSAYGGLLLSKFPLEIQENIALGSSGTVYGHSVVDLGVKKLDVYFGLSVAKAEFDELIGKIEDAYANTGRDFLFTGVHFGATYLDLSKFEIGVDSYVGDNGGFVVSDGFAISDGKYYASGINHGPINQVHTATLKLN